MTNQDKTGDVYFWMTQHLKKVHGLFVLSFENEGDKTTFSKYYTPKLEIKDFNVLIDGKSHSMFQ